MACRARVRLIDAFGSPLERALEESPALSPLHRGAPTRWTTHPVWRYAADAHAIGARQPRRAVRVNTVEPLVAESGHALLGCWLRLRDSLSARVGVHIVEGRRGPCGADRDPARRCPASNAPPRVASSPLVPLQRAILSDGGCRRGGLIVEPMANPLRSPRRGEAAT
jgi:hypothetical protein